jgi:hypothetical protein
VEDDERAVLDRLRVLLRKIGCANDAQDHGAPAEAESLRREAVAGIGELLREHAFLSGLYPDLGAALATWRLEAFGWSELVDDVERRLQFVDPQLVPWNRVVHFDGRATEVPDWVVALGRDGHRSAEEQLRRSLAREDRVIQATPLALRLMLGALRFGLLRDAAAVREIGERIGAAARLQAETAERRGAKATRPDWSLFREDRLWPPFVSAERDEALWAEWRPGDEEVLGWALLTLAVIDEHEAFL